MRTGRSPATASERIQMLDVLLLGATLILGALALLYIRGCAALLNGDRDER
jgi:hypothetical protein